MDPNDFLRGHNARSAELLEIEDRERVYSPTAVVLVSGGFDPLHVGHLHLIKEASRFGRVTVALNSDSWLVRKKGYAFMPWEERAEILRALWCVHSVIPVDDSDGTVCAAIKDLQPTHFANGGDRTNANPYEAAVCDKFSVMQLFGIGGGKIQSSSELVRKAQR